MAMATPTTTTTIYHQTSRSSVRPSWLQAALTDIEQRFQSLSLHKLQSPDDVSDSFADRAENYYRKRPQLLSLLQDLYNKYLSLADRYVQALLLKPPQHCRSQSQVSLFPSDLDDGDTDPDPPDSSDAESSLSFQPPVPPTPASDSIADEVIADLVTRSIDNEVLRHEVGLLEKHLSESSRKMELQASLLEVLESERMVLLTENARLGFKAAAMKEENEGLSAEVGFMRRKAGDLARCVVKLREDHRVCMLGRKIEALQAQIYGLEKRNRECYEVMARREEEKAELMRGVCAELERVKAENRRLREAATAAAKTGKGRCWLRRLQELALCGSHVGKE